MTQQDDQRELKATIARYFRDKKPEPVDLRFVHRSYGLSEDLLLALREEKR